LVAVSPLPGVGHRDGGSFPPSPSFSQPPGAKVDSMTSQPTHLPAQQANHVPVFTRPRRSAGRRVREDPRGIFSSSRRKSAVQS